MSSTGFIPRAFVTELAHGLFAVFYRLLRAEVYARHAVGAVVAPDGSSFNKLYVVEWAGGSAFTAGHALVSFVLAAALLLKKAKA